MTKQMVISGLISMPGMGQAWRHPEVDPGAAIDIEAYKRAAQLCEQGMFDVFFIADRPGATVSNLEKWTQAPVFMNFLEPITVLAACAGATKHIGLGGTISSSFFEPFNIARQMLSLDHICGGRAAWNVVTSASDDAARNFGLDQLPDHDKRYIKARECLDIVLSYWDTWEDDAFIYDKDGARNFDPEKFHVTDYEGSYFKVRGGLPVARSKQGRPVIIQAGASEAGKEFAAETAEIVFGTGKTIEMAKAFYDDLKGRMAKFGRDRDELKVISGIRIIVAPTEEEAKAQEEQLESLITMESRVQALAHDLETDLSGLPLDKPIPADRVPTHSNNHQIYFAEAVALINQGLTLAEVATAFKRGGSAIVGDPVQVADHMQAWFEAGASDGFMIGMAYWPGNLEAIVELLVPELQRRGLMRTAYTGDTLRENLGLARPENRHVAPRDSLAALA